MVYRPTKNTPITEKTVLKNANNWLSVIRYGESASIIQLQDDCEYRATEIINNAKILKKVIGPHHRKYMLKYFRYDNTGIEGNIRYALVELAYERNIFNPKIVRMEPERILEYIFRKGYDVGLFISHISVSSEKGITTINYLEELLQKCRNISLVLFFESDITNPKYRMLMDKCSLLYDNVFFYPLYRETDCRQFIKYQSEIWNMKVGKDVENEILNLSGGYLWIISHFLRFVRDNPKKPLDSEIGNHLLMSKIDVIWNKLSDKEKEILKKISISKITEADRSTHEYSFLNKIGFIKKDQTIGIPLFTQVIEKEKKLNQIRSENQKIYINNVDATDSFTRKERLFLNLILTNKNILKRDIIAKYLWGDDEDKYSDWAIDRLAHRVRKKLQNLGIDENLVRTIKKKGFKFG